MTIIIIREECHGVIGVATSISEAVKWLILSNWLTAYDEGDSKYNKETCEWEHISIIEKYGENWKEIFPSLPDDEIIDFLEGGFYFEETTLYGAE